MKNQPIRSGLKLKCGECGEGRLFRRYLKFRDHCESCGQDFSVADTADGPAFFVGSLVMILFAPFYFILPVVTTSVWLKVVLFAALLSIMVGLILALLPRFKGGLFNLQISNRAEEAKFSDIGKHGVPPQNWKHRTTAK